ncbi:TadE/TadG family type IV pilus assembly protein [Thiohalobacter thiocyanaticus]|uniref:Pilus assembly protein n=1 Tax=Thiohalobacter thiocyanaticus TaxID=585455 RepID=A0A426QI63_9GAMM|nr:TadE/TadG family type IV pilus assembly protein [Thiohalobacter thiocyanaticus]RRQ21438.1 pilus assembly protein [Thiohalobacter thiocyanaticus]
MNATGALRRRQRGSTALEFALLFLPFFALFYAIVSYGLVFLLMESFSSAAEGGARAAVAVDPTAYTDTNDYLNNGVIPVVRDQVAAQLDWLPDSVKNQVLGADNQNVGVSLSNRVLTVEVGYEDYHSNPVIPMLTLPMIGDLPKVPAALGSRANVRL